MIRTGTIGGKTFARRRYSEVPRTSPLHSPQFILPVEKKTISIVTLDNKAEVAKIPDSRFVARLKFEEQKQFTHKRRIRFNYKKNYSAALALPYSTRELEQNCNDPNDLLSLSEKLVIEHANRRVDLFFYTLIAYFKTGFFPTIGHTNLQHGRGRVTKEGESLTQACHSSFTPSLLDQTIYQNKKEGAKYKSLLSGTHLMDSLNSTVELPSFVNRFDTLLENRCRQKCLCIIGNVSLGKINPVEGLTVFLKMMQDILTDLKQAEPQRRSALVQNSLMSQPYINPRLIDLVIRGTLATTFDYQTQIVADDYIQLLLLMKPEEKTLCKNEGSKEKLYLNKIMEMQNEILETKSSCNRSAL